MKPSQGKLKSEKLHNEEENETSSSEDDEDAEFLTEEIEKGFFKVLSRLKKKDAKLYDEAIRYYPTNDSENGSGVKNNNKQAKQEYKDWLKGKLKKVDDDELKKDLEGLHDFWANPKISKDDKFLRDYILNKKFLDPDDEFDVQKELEKLSEEEKEIEEQVNFEHKYNCRYEDPNSEFMKEGSAVKTNEGKFVNNNKKAKRKRKADLEIADREKLLHSDIKISDEHQQKSFPEKKLKKHVKDQTNIETRTDPVDKTEPKKKKHKKKKESEAVNNKLANHKFPNENEKNLLPGAKSTTQPEFENKLVKKKHLLPAKKINKIRKKRKMKSVTQGSKSSSFYEKRQGKLNLNDENFNQGKLKKEAGAVKIMSLLKKNGPLLKRSEIKHVLEKQKKKLSQNDGTLKKMNKKKKTKFPPHDPKHTEFKKVKLRHRFLKKSH